MPSPATPTGPYYSPATLGDIWPDLKQGRIVLAPVRIGMDRRTGKVIAGWPHVVQSFEVIFATPFHTRVLRRWVGSFVPHLLGESAVPRVVTRFFWAIATAIDLWEPGYSLQRVRVRNRKDDDTGLTSAEELRSGSLTHRIEGVYRPRGHLGDFTPETRKTAGLIGRPGGAWGVR